MLLSILVTRRVRLSGTLTPFLMLSGLELNTILKCNKCSRAGRE